MFELCMGYFCMMGLGMWLGTIKYEGFTIFKLVMCLCCALFPVITILEKVLNK